MVLSLAYLAFSAVLRLLVRGRRSEFTKDVELLVVRHQLAVLGRQERRPMLRPADRAWLAALARLRPPHRRHGLVVRPETLLRWHRELVRRKWTQPGHVGTSFEEGVSANLEPSDQVPRLFTSNVESTPIGRAV